MKQLTIVDEFREKLEKRLTPNNTKENEEAFKKGRTTYYKCKQKYPCYTTLIQKAAIDSLIYTFDIDYETNVKLAFHKMDIEIPEIIPIIEDLTYSEGTALIKFLNKEYRKLGK